MNPLEPSDYRYWAFISYSSKDKQWGRWLHRAIETYGIPADPGTRTISPSSTITVPEYIGNRIKENTSDSLDEAELLAAGNTNLLQQISKARNALQSGIPSAPNRMPAA